MKNNYVRLPLSIDKSGGRREVVLAEPDHKNGTFIVRSIPAFTYGLGPEDVIRVLDAASGGFEVLTRGGEVVVRMYVDGPLDSPAIKTLIDEVVSMGGSFEVGKNADAEGYKSLLLIALSVTIGFGKIEALFAPLTFLNISGSMGMSMTQGGAP